MKLDTDAIIYNAPVAVRNLNIDSLRKVREHVRRQRNVGPFDMVVLIRFSFPPNRPDTCVTVWQTRSRS